MPRACGLGWVAIAMCVLLGAAHAGAQISPGKLSHAHRALEGTSGCTSCHKVSGGQEFKCLECHTEIASRLTQRRGLHASYGLRAGDSAGCARCHSEHNGENFALIKWDAKTLDHRSTGFALDGKHASLGCAQCHTAAHMAPSEKGTIKNPDLSRTFLGLSPSCASCHQDKHGGRLGSGCEQCHNTSDWKNTAKFDHSKTRFALTGLHAPLTCQKCHTAGSDGQVRWAPLAFDKCSACHSDPHKGSFAQGCQACHSTSGWKKVALAAVEEHFDHSRTKFPLLGKHGAVDCAQCHAGGDFKKPVALARCSDCHKDAHEGQFAKRADGGECSSCHTVEGWKPATFGVKEHAATQYPLQGKHVTTACAQCHVPAGKATRYKLAFAHCGDCHRDAHQKQFAAAPYRNQCESCHTVEGYSPATFTLAQHQKSRFALSGGHMAIPCGECHKAATPGEPAPKGERVSQAVFHWTSLTCAQCHDDPHQGQFAQRMQQPRGDGSAAGCEACHSTRDWHDLARFDHNSTTFALQGAHRGTSCIECHRPPSLETTMRHVDFKAAAVRCEGCHEDAHAGQFADKARGVTECAPCHTAAQWKPSLFDHDKRTGFPLTGVHHDVRCQRCHSSFREVEGKSVLFYQPTPKECAACHGAKAR